MCVLEVLRSLLFVPGNREDMLQKASQVMADALVPDMEDSVPDAEKENARNVISSALIDLSKGGQKIIPRTNALDTGLIEDDLRAVIGPFIYGVSVGKFETSWEVRHVDNLISNLELRAGLTFGTVKLIPWIETAKGILNADEICKASSRIIAVAFGAEDFTNDMEIERTAEGNELAYPRSIVALAARANSVLAVDTPYPNFRDSDGLLYEANLAKSVGFKGKFAIHPSQVEPINNLFYPTLDQIEYARKVISAFKEVEGHGRGATSIDGKMIDVPIVKRAESLLALVESLENYSKSK
jgi:citrate lyase subunit beta/citryl-CoA lyase